MESLSLLLQTSLSELHLLFGSWGYAIIALTVVVRFLLLPAQAFNLSQQKKIKQLQPQLEALNKTWKSDPWRLVQETGKLKKSQGIKAFRGLLLALLPMPLFLSIYRTMSSMQSLVGENFLWLTSLATPDSLFILPLLVGGCAYLQQHLLSKKSDSAPNLQLQWLTKLMPAVSFAFMVAMPSGLVLYYAVSGVLQVLGDWGLRKFMA